MQIALIDKKISKAVLLVSKSQKYQRKVFIFLCFIWAQIAYHSLINPIMFTNPLFKLNNKIQTQAYCCLAQNQNKCQYVNDFTGTFYADLYCNNRDVRMGLQSIFAIGSVICITFIPIISDSKGKKFAFFLALLAMLIGDIGLFLGTFNKIYFLIAICQLLCAGSNGAIAVSYSINSDFFSDDLRQKSVIYYCIVWGLADMSVILVYYLMPYWMFFQIFIITIPIAFLFFYFQTFFLQSAHYAINSKRDFALANQIIQKLAQVNSATVSELQQAQSVLKQLQQKIHQGTNEKKQEQKTSQTLKIIFKTPKYLKALICLVFIKMSYYSFYFGVQGSLQRTGFNLGISVFLLGFGQFTGYLTGSQFIPKHERRKVLFITNLLLVVCTIVFLTNVVKQSPFIASVLLYISFTLSSYNFSAITLVQTQSFPSSIRSTSVGLAYGISYIIRIMMPFLIGFLNQHKIQPIIASSLFILILGVLPPLALDQTYGYTNLQQPLVVKKQFQLTQQGFNKDSAKNLDHF